MSRIKVEVIKTNPAGEQYVEDYYFVDPAAAVAFANYQDEHATVINHHGEEVHVSPVVAAAAEIVNRAIEDIPEIVVIDTVESVDAEVTVDAEEVVADADAEEKPSKKSRKK